jgi:hypothetical protein
MHPSFRAARDPEWRVLVRQGIEQHEIKEPLENS